MAQKNRVREITITDDRGAFTSFFKKITWDRSDFNLEGLSALRSLLSNEKARMIHVIKTRNPISIYDLAKMLQRDFKSVCEDINLLEEFGFIDLIKENTGKRKRLKPIVIIDILKIEILL